MSKHPVIINDKRTFIKVNHYYTYAIQARRRKHIAYTI